LHEVKLLNRSSSAFHISIVQGALDTSEIIVSPVLLQNEQFKYLHFFHSLASAVVLLHIRWTLSRVFQEFFRLPNFSFSAFPFSHIVLIPSNQTSQSLVN